MRETNFSVEELEVELFNTIPIISSPMESEDALALGCRIKTLLSDLKLISFGNENGKGARAEEIYSSFMKEVQNKKIKIHCGYLQ